MKKLLFILFIFATSASYAGTPTIATDSVYICDSKKATVYHLKKDCKGLNKCTHKIETVTLADAKNKYGRRNCHICSKQ